MLEAAQADRVDVPRHPFLDRGLGQTGELETVRDVLPHSLPWHQAEVLKDHRHFAAGRVHLGPIDDDPPVIDTGEPMHATEEGGLPTARRAQDAERLAVTHRKIEPLEYRDRAQGEPLRRVLDRDADRRGRHATLRPAVWDAAVDPRTTSSAGRRTCRSCTGSSSRRVISIRAAIAPISRCGTRAVVSGGSRRPTIGMSLMPTSERSAGTRTPISRAARRAPSARRSFAAKIAVGATSRRRFAAA